MTKADLAARLRGLSVDAAINYDYPKDFIVAIWYGDCLTIRGAVDADWELPTETQRLYISEFGEMPLDTGEGTELFLQMLENRQESYIEIWVDEDRNVWSNRDGVEVSVFDDENDADWYSTALILDAPSKMKAASAKVFLPLLPVAKATGLLPDDLLDIAEDGNGKFQVLDLRVIQDEQA